HSHPSFGPQAVHHRPQEIHHVRRGGLHDRRQGPTTRIGGGLTWIVSGYISGNMTSTAQRKATAAHRKRNKAKGHVRVEMRVPRTDVGLLRELAECLRNAGPPAETMRSTLQT